MIYFAYGSNMRTSWLRQGDRAPSARPLGVGVLRGHELRFHKLSKDGSAKCDAAPGSGGTVYGVLYEIDEVHRAGLDVAEGQGVGYERCRVFVEDAGGRVVEAETYLAKPSSLRPGLPPYTWYRALVVAGARQHGLPEEYVAAIESVAAIEDDNRERDRRARAKL